MVNQAGHLFCSEASDIAVTVFNRENLLPLLLPCLQHSVYGYPLATAVGEWQLHVTILVPDCFIKVFTDGAADAILITRCDNGKEWLAESKASRPQIRARIYRLCCWTYRERVSMTMFAAAPHCLSSDASFWQLCKFTTYAWLKNNGDSDIKRIDFFFFFGKVLAFTKSY